MDAAMRRTGGDETLANRYDAVRAQTERLADPLSPEDCALQSMTDASPTKWHLAHTSWYFETFVLEEAAPGYRLFREPFRVLFNSYYNSVGEQYARPARGLLSRPSLEEVLAYRRHVDRHMADLLGKEPDLDAQLRGVIELGLHHEQQHQELILTDLKHAFGCNPLDPAYRDQPEPVRVAETAMSWCAYEEGLSQFGHDGRGFAFDNELPRHRVFHEAFELASRPVTNGEYVEFVEAGGYRQARVLALRRLVDPAGAELGGPALLATGRRRLHDADARRPARAAAGRARVSRELLRSRCLRPLVGCASSHRVRVGAGRGGASDRGELRGGRPAAPASGTATRAGARPALR